MLALNKECTTAGLVEAPFPHQSILSYKRHGPHIIHNEAFFDFSLTYLET